mgnify:CR=1 FL=1
MCPQKILFISHNCEINGAVNVLLELAEFWKTHEKVAFTFLFGVPTNNFILNKFSNLGEIYNLNEISQLNVDDFDLVFSNTIANGWILQSLNPLKPIVVTYVHEMEFAIKSMKPSIVKGTLEYSNYFIACSMKVKENLCYIFKISKRRVSVINGFISENKFHDEFSRSEHEGDSEKLTIGILANMDYRKGIDRFLSVLPSLPHEISNREIFWIWCGHGSKFYDNFIPDPCRDRVSMPGLKKQPWNELGQIDLLFSFSREDPFPLSFLESLARGIPIAGIQGAGGIDELEVLGFAKTCKFELNSIVGLLKLFSTITHPNSRRILPWTTRNQAPKIINKCYSWLKGSFIDSFIGIPRGYSLEALGKMDTKHDAGDKKIFSYSEFLHYYANDSKSSLTENNITSNILFSVILPTHNPNLFFLENAVNSIISQVYGNWELIIVDDCSNDEQLRYILNSYSELDSRIQVSFLNTHNHISSTLNEGVRISKGKWVTFIDQDDKFHSFALYRIKQYLETAPNTSIIYTDEDKIDENGKHFDPYFKPGWNYRLLLSQNYFCHLIAIKRALFDEISGFRVGFEGAQDWDLCLRATSKLRADKIGHVEEVLYHWRATEGSTALSLSEKGNWVSIAQNKTIESHLQTVGIKGRIKKIFDHWEILPAKSFAAPRTCMIYYDSISSKSHIDKDPTAERPYLKILNADQYNTDIDIKSLPESKYSEVFIFASRYIEPMHEEWLERLIFHSLAQNIGAVGPKLLHPGTNRIISAGMFYQDGMVQPLYESCPFDYLGDKCRAILSQNVWFLHPALLVIQKSKLPSDFILGHQPLKSLTMLCDFLVNKGLQNLFLPSSCCYLHGREKTWFERMDSIHYENQKRPIRDKTLNSNHSLVQGIPQISKN